MVPFLQNHPGLATPRTIGNAVNSGSPVTTPKPLHNPSHLITAARSEIETVQAYIGIPFLFLLADASGTVMECISSATAPAALQSQHLQLKRGVRLDRDHAGVNAISLAMETGKVSLVRGNEHSSGLLQHLNCICVPLIRGNIAEAYIDVSFERDREPEWALPLIVKLADSIAAAWKANDPEQAEAARLHFFDEHRLSGREREVAALWYLNKSALFIAQELGITEGTVRNVLKKIYVKLSIGDRSALIHKLNTWDESGSAAEIPE